MNFVARAKALIAGNLHRSSLAILPLAAALALQAAPILPTGNLSCTADDEGVVSSCSGTSSQINNPSGLQGVKLFTNGPISYFGASGSGTAFLILQTSGNLNEGILSGTGIPISYDFTLGLPSGGSITSWDLVFTLTQGAALATVSDSGTGSGSFSNPLNLVSDNLLAGNPLTVEAILTVSWTGTELTIEVPSNSFDIGTASPSNDVPEPSTLGLAAVGLLLAGGARLRLRTRRA